MTTQAFRLPTGGRIDRSRPLEFTFNGQSLIGYEGDTLASALLANGILLVARSFRYHCPRGIYSAGVEEPHAFVAIGNGATTEPNVRATRQRLFDGLEARSQNGWPSLRFDLGALVGAATRFLPVGFYYKTFMWPSWHWYTGVVRRLAGVAPLPEGGDPDRYDKINAHCDILVVGGGPAGLAAALAAAAAGVCVIIADDQPELGGALLSEPLRERERVDKLIRDVEQRPNVTILTSCTVVAAWDDNYFTALEEIDQAGGGAVSQRLWKIRSRKTILATGAIERPLVFPNNDRPGVMLAASARQYVNRYAVRPGNHAVVFTNNDTAWHAAFELHAAGIHIAAIVDVRAAPPDALMEAASNRGIACYPGYEVADTKGRARIRGVTIEKRGQARDRIRLDCDLLCASGGWSPTLHLYSQAGGRLTYCDQRACFVPANAPGSIRPAGAANGHFAIKDAIDDGRDAGTVPTSVAKRAAASIEPYWGYTSNARARQWVDLHHDVTLEDVHLAAREGFVSVEHLKRYTTIGMAPDQGKTSNVNALAALGRATGRTPGEVGTTTFRPPFNPIRLGALAGRETGTRIWPLRRLPNHDWHVDAGGLMEDFGGWLRAACYLRPGEDEDAAIHREVIAARRGVALLDSSSLGKIEVTGPDAAQFLDRIYVNRVDTLKVGRARYGMMLNENGVLTDDGVLARLDEDLFLVSSSSSGTADVYLALEEWLETEWPKLDVIIHNATSQWATFAVSGPYAREVVTVVLPDADLTFPHMSVQAGTRGTAAYRLARVSFTGELSFELSIPADDATRIRDALLAAGAAYGITPLGQEALDILRLEKGYLEVGVDTDLTTTPLDVGWARAIARKTADFIGKRSLSRRAQAAPGRLQLVGLEPLDRSALLPVGSHVIDPATRRPQGHVTSSCLSPTLEKSIALALLAGGHARLDEIVTVDVEGSSIQARVVPLAFYDPEGHRLNGHA
ncbi:MAG: sarcosine oxidase subunit alpha family protein [Sphingomonadales bacterium]|nr:sarcosine oxidase subunit alpha family protein [Sphingomonadales bacterium]